MQLYIYQEFTNISYEIQTSNVVSNARTAFISYEKEKWEIHNRGDPAFSAYKTGL